MTEIGAENGRWCREGGRNPVTHRYVPADRLAKSNLPAWLRLGSVSSDYQHSPQLGRNRRVCFLLSNVHICALSGHSLSS